MSGDGILNVAGMIVVVAGITTVVMHSNSANVIKAFGSAFSGAIRAAVGR